MNDRAAQLPATVPQPLRDEGALLLRAMLEEPALGELEDAFASLAVAKPGRRPPTSTYARSAASSTINAVVADWLGAAARAVRVLLLDKRDSANWALGWHQDRTIAVDERRAVPGFEIWTKKAGRDHVAPPFEVLARMITARIHLDAVDAQNAPLLIAPGSHRVGIVAEPAIDAMVARCGSRACLAERGDVWFYATPILHASARAAAGRRRRVVQVDFAAFDLPGGLQWTA